MTKNQCEWCGHDHPVTALCTKRPTWGRRGFLCMLGMAAVGAVAGQLPVPEVSLPPGVGWTVREVGELADTPNGVKLFVVHLEVLANRISKMADLRTAKWTEV